MPRAADDYSSEQYKLGILYAQGDGVPQDFEKAIFWLYKAAKSGNALAQYKVGLMLVNGQGVPPSYAKDALMWYRNAAEAGNKSAQVNLADMYAHGKVVAANFTEAAYWYSKASRQNSLPTRQTEENTATKRPDMGAENANHINTKPDCAGTASSQYDRNQSLAQPCSKPCGSGMHQTREPHCEHQHYSGSPCCFPGHFQHNPMYEHSCVSRCAGSCSSSDHCNPCSCGGLTENRLSSPLNKNNELDLTAITKDRKSVTERLIELDILHTNKIINDSEYSTTKQRILKSM